MSAYGAGDPGYVISTADDPNLRRGQATGHSNSRPTTGIGHHSARASHTIIGADGRRGGGIQSKHTIRPVRRGGHRPAGYIHRRVTEQTHKVGGLGLPNDSLDVSGVARVCAASGGIVDRNRYAVLASSEAIER